MQVIFYIVMALALLGMLWSVFMLVRNTRVFNYRGKIIDGVYRHDDWMELRRVFTSVSYKRMLYRFWKPLDSFYDDEFLKKIGVK